jgi:hypothetical protein
MQIQEIPPLQTFDAKRKLHRVAQDQFRIWSMTAEDKAKGLRTDGVAPCLILCAMITNGTQIIFGMHHWSGSDADDSETKQNNAAIVLKEFCGKFRKAAQKAGIERCSRKISSRSS